MQVPLTVPTIPFVAPASHRWESVAINGLPTPVLFPAAEPLRPLTKREEDVFRRLYIFYLDCMDLNEDSRRRRACGMLPSPDWRSLMRSVGHDEENQDHLWGTSCHWVIRFHPRCWLAVGQDLNEARWWEGPYRKY